MDNQISLANIMEIFPEFTLRLIEPHEIVDFTKFVFEVYKETYQERHQIEMLQNELLNMIEEDQEYYVHSFYYVLEYKNTVIGTRKVTRWNETMSFPITTVFGWDANKFLQDHPNITEVYHLSRVCISSNLLKKFDLKKSLRFVLIKQMEKFILKSYATDSSAFITECDVDYLKVVEKLFGLPYYVVAEPKFYLGSQTVPIIMIGSERENTTLAKLN